MSFSKRSYLTWLVGCVFWNTRSAATTTSGQTQYLDRFNYNSTIQRSDGFHDYGPQNWADISCDAVNHLNECLAYIDKWEEAQGWSIQQNYCEWCPDDGTNLCGLHHQAPLALKRSHADPNSTDYTKCIDRISISRVHVKLRFRYIGSFVIPRGMG